jgi:hypothetical protein
MRFFDYKFLILLGLTLVVYFIYREVEYLRVKINKIETELNQKKLISNESDPVIPKIDPVIPKIAPVIPKTTQVSQLPIIKNINIPSKSPEKVINLDLVSQSFQPLAQIPKNNTFKESNILSEHVDTSEDETSVNDENEDKYTESESGSETGSETESETESESSKHLAIYSNDNEQFDSAQNSLIDIVEANKINIENPDLKSTMDNIINELSSESEKSNKSKQQEIDEIIMEKEKQLSEMSPKLTVMSPKSEKEKQLTEAELNQLKLADIKDIASKLGLTMSKKVNGQLKHKNKQDFIQEILLK